MSANGPVRYICPTRIPLQTDVRIQKRPVPGLCGEATILRVPRVPAVWYAKKNFLTTAHPSLGFVVPETLVDRFTSAATNALPSSKRTSPWRIVSWGRNPVSCKESLLLFAGNIHPHLFVSTLEEFLTIWRTRTSKALERKSKPRRQAGLNV